MFGGQNEGLGHRVLQTQDFCFELVQGGGKAEGSEQKNSLFYNIAKKNLTSYEALKKQRRIQDGGGGGRWLDGFDPF